ncbi:MAG: LPS export ABC transporter permease LptG [Deltaproteobacteria bacterium]|nr:LPS export ABC transporter permease LptG [Deltaproteobacteria bacterium]
MSIIHKYLTAEISKYFAMVMVAVVSVYIAVDFFEKIDDFMEAGLPFSKALSFFILKTPFIVAQIIPVCILLSVLVVFGLMTRNFELVALKSSGVSIYYLVWPVLGLGLLCSAVLFLFSEVVVPITMEKANRIWLREVRHESAVMSRGKNIWVKGHRSIIHIEYFNPSKNTVFGVSVNTFDEDFRLIRRIDAKDGVFKEGTWVLHDVMAQTLDREDEKYNILFHETQVENLNILPENLQRILKKSEEMNFKELLNFIKKVESEGYDATIYRVDFYAKFAFPFICIIMSIMGTGLAVRGKTMDSLPVAIAYGIGVAFLYWIFYSFCLSLGKGEMLPPVIAAWTANLVFFCVGILTLMHAE